MMKLNTTVLLFLVGSCWLFTSTWARVEILPLELKEQLQMTETKGTQGVQVDDSLLGLPVLADIKQDVQNDTKIGLKEIENKNEPSRPIENREEAVESDNNLFVPPEVVEDEILGEQSDLIEPLRSSKASGCSVSLRKETAKNPQPVLLQTKSEEFYPYNDEGVLQVATGKTLDMWCPNGFKSIQGKLLTASCVGGSSFRVEGTTYDFNEFTCKSWPAYVAKKTGARCNGGIMIRVGFQISASRFAQQMEICFNEGEEVTRYVHHTLNPGSNFYQTGVDRLTFQTAGFFDGKNVDRLYTQNSQIDIIDQDLGGGGQKYFDPKTNIFLARGHMAAKADFVYGFQQRATFLFVNVAPQWQVFNAGNWARVEDGVRAWVSKNKLNVDCYTGVYGVTTLPNKQGQEIPLYLTKDYNNNGLIPVPMLYFRVVIDSATKRGIVFLGVNNPHLTMEQIRKDYILCPDVSDQVTYINWKKTDIRAGYSYACRVEDFVSKVTHLPELKAAGGLLV